MPAPVAQDTGDEPVQLNLVDTDIGGVLRMAARFTGRQFLCDPRVTGKMTVVSMARSAVPRTISSCCSGVACAALRGRNGGVSVVNAAKMT